MAGVALAVLGACGGGGSGGGGVNSGGGSSSIPPRVDGFCSEVTVNRCIRGTFANVLDSETEHLWNCEGSGGGSTAMCSIPRLINGRCGTEVNQCLKGNLNDIGDNEADFLWNCDGLHGGQSAMCSLPKPIDGECGEEVNMCLLGNLDDIDDSDGEHLWNCDGQHGGQPAMCSLQKTVVCPNGAPASDNPLLCKRGDTTTDYRGHSADHMLPGIDRLPLDRIQLTNEEMQRHFAILEGLWGHALSVGIAACESYVTASEGCEHHENRAGIIKHPEGDEETRTGLIPFTQILDLSRESDQVSFSDIFAWRDELLDAMQDLRILSVSIEPNTFYLGDADKPFLQIRSAGNGGSNHSWFLSIYYTDIRDLLARAMAANKLLIVAGMHRKPNGDYIRHYASSSCRDVDYGCFWTWFAFPDYSGTSYSTPNIAASLASILSIFPDTSHQDLAKLARACAKKTGEGIDGPNGLLATSGGFGVADFSCMDEIVAATADLSEDETATLTIDGREVAVRPRSITVTEPEPR